ncbi:hypothetical protein QBC46DRAFT_448001 [Diplogelasinospora grovesii]|uniref:PhoD-like phosphatase domain-containing protein n=1 Tax=Diplogelasinospora grovesii TaxID=303347 RepID=A0AAN6NAC5_9PEZI|nr:hypothetical protein QBC46DRAFT_448001 [Diplogelasinospora grovesii]
MSAPYWGQLPPPQAGQTRARRLSDDFTPAADRRQSLDGAAQGQPRSNRVSVQTTKSDAPTDSTLSAFASPTASSFQGQGLTPRPPSLPYGANQYPPELLEKRWRRRSKNQEQDYELPLGSGPPPPAVPDVPRAPPVSFKYPPGAGGSHYPHPVAPPGPPRPARPMEAAEEYYKVPTPASQKEDHPVLDRARDTLDGTAASSRARRNGTDPALARTASVRDEANGQPRSRRASMSQQQQPDRRKILADDRSPLQKLEQTLREGSLSKEEKRAKIEAAEQAVREKPGGNGTAPQVQAVAEKVPVVQQVRFRDRRASTAGHDEGRPQLMPPTRPTLPNAPPAQKGPLSQNPPGDGQKQSSMAETAPRGHVPESRIPVPSAAQSSGIPQRNLSFRERAAKNEAKLPNGFDENAAQDAASPPVATPNGGSSLARSGSNKLKKNPPADARQGQRRDAEGKQPGLEMRNGPPVTNTRTREMDSMPAAPVTPPGYGGGPVRMAGPPLPPKPAEYRQPPTRPEQTAGPELLPSPVVTRLTKTGTPRSQNLGRNPSQQTVSSGSQRSPIALKDAAPVTAAAAAAATAATGAMARATPRHTPSPPHQHQHHHEARRDTRSDSETDDDTHHHASDLFYHARDKLRPGQGMFKPTQYLDEWRKGTVGTLSGALLDLNVDVPDNADKDKAWWEGQTPQSSKSRRGSMASRPKKAEAFEGEYDDKRSPTRFKPPLYLKCGPLLRFCGIHQERPERVPTRSTRNAAASADREIWRGTVMIVTSDADSSYDIAPTLRLFVQPIELLPPPPREIDGDALLAPEYVDPIAGHPKLGRKGETLYVRPVDYLDEARDLSRDETDDGLFEKARSPPDEGPGDPPGSFAARRKRIEVDGEKAGKYKEVRGFRLHAERGYTFWRFNIEVELRDKQQRIAYRINRGPATGFWVPAKGQAMNIMFHSCNGFSVSANPDQFSGPDPMWRDVLNTHQSQPFHVMIGGGDQIYNDKCMQETKLFKQWLMLKNPLHKHNAPFTAEMQDELETFYLERYAMWFSQGLFAMANAQIPMVNMYDDHDIIDGFGSYPHHFMNSPVFSGLGNVAFKYYMLFQHQSVPDEMEKDEPSWLLGTKPGPYINELSRSMFMFLGSKVALLAVDARTERTRETVISTDTWNKIMDRCYHEIATGRTQHLLVLLGVPIAYPRLVWLENILTSRLMDPVKALGKTGLFGNLLNHFDGGVEVLDDLDDHWTAKNHKQERAFVIQDLQDLAADRSIRVTILSGDVHLAAIGQFYSNSKHGLPKHKDFRYMPNVISSAIVNQPPPDFMADILNKRNKVHHLDKETDEDMIPIFAHGVDGKARNNKRLLPHRNWCSIREYTPGATPPATPPPDSDYDLTPLGTPPGTANGGVSPGEVEPASGGGGGGGGIGGLLRRLSGRNRGPSFRGPDGVRDRTRPPLSGGLLRTFSRRAGVASAGDVGQQGQRPQGFLTRTLSGSGSGRLGSLFRRRNNTTNTTAGRRDDGGINGNWGPDTEEEDDYDEGIPRSHHQNTGGSGMTLRGGAGSDFSGNEEFEDGDESYFSVKNNTGRDKPLPPAPAPEPEPTYMSGGAGPGRGGSSSAASRSGPLGMSRAAPSSQGDMAPEQHLASPHSGSQQPPRPSGFGFHRTPTGLTSKQLKHANELAVNLEGGLEVCLNVEISPKDPGGSTVPYRLVVPRLWYEDEGSEELEQQQQQPEKQTGGIRRFISLKR